MNSYTEKKEWIVSAGSILPGILPPIPLLQSGFYQRSVEYSTETMSDGKMVSIIRGCDYFLVKQ